MAEGRMSQIMSQGDGFGQVLVQKHGPGDGAGNLGHFQGMGQPGAVLVPRWIEKNLGLVFEPPKGVAEKDAVLIHLKCRANGTGILGPGAAPGFGTPAPEGGDEIGLALFELFTQVGGACGDLVFCFCYHGVHRFWPILTGRPSTTASWISVFDPSRNGNFWMDSC